MLSLVLNLSSSILVGSGSIACSLYYLYIPWFSFHHCLSSRGIHSVSDENKVSLFLPALPHLNSIIHPKPMQEFIQANLLLRVWNLSYPFQLLIPPSGRKMRMIAGLWSGRASLTPLCWRCQIRLPHSQHRTQERSSCLSQPLLDFPPWANPGSNRPLTSQGVMEVSFPKENRPEFYFCLFTGKK